MHEKWLVVADRSGARIMAVRDGGKVLEPRVTLEHPEGRLQDRQIDSDRPGRSFDSGGEGRHAMTREESASERIAADFAREIASHLDKARGAGRLDELVLVAEPRFLGLLRDAVDKHTAGCVIASVDKDLAHLAPDELVAHLGDALRPAHPR
ncbi:MAG: host attachment protein [Gammaproteobacteria bacterium]